MLRRQALLVAVLLSAASLAAADDAQQAAAAAAAAGQGGGGYQMPPGVAQAVAGAAQGGAPPGAAGGAAGGGAPKPGTSGGGFQRQLSAPVIMKKGDQKSDAPSAHGAKGVKGGKKKREPESKYKSRDLMENSEHAYRFDSQGNPIRPGVKKHASKPSKASAAEPEDATEEPASCSDGRSCTGKGSDADAL